MNLLIYTVLLPYSKKMKKNVNNDLSRNLCKDFYASDSHIYLKYPLADEKK